MARIIIEQFKSDETGQNKGCAPRALAKVTGRSFEEINGWLLRKGYRSNNRVGTQMNRFMTFQKDSTVNIDGVNFEFNNTYANRETLASYARRNNSGKHLVRVRRHAVAVIDGVIYDVFDSSRKFVVAAYKLKENPITENINQLNNMANLLSGVSLIEAKVEAAKLSKTKGYVSVMENDGDFDLKLGKDENAYLLFNNGSKVDQEAPSTEKKVEPKKAEPKEVKAKTEKKVEPKKAEVKKEEPKKVAAKKVAAKKAEPKKATAKKAEPKVKTESKKKKPIKWVIDMVKEKQRTIDEIRKAFIKMGYEAKTATRQLSIVRQHDEFIVKDDVVKFKK